MANYTMYFKDYIDYIGGSENLPLILNDMPTWNNQSFKDRFIKRNLIREIGSETAEMFTHNLENCILEVISLYKDKIQNQIDNIDKLFDRVANESENKENEYYMNPLNNNASRLREKAKITSDRTRLFNFFSSNAKVMSEINEIDIMFEKALQYCDILFFGVY